MGRTVPSFRIVIAEEKQEWKPFRNALDKSEKKAFDEMWDIPRLYVSACSNSVQLVPLHPIIISILFHHYKELLECRKQVEQLMMNNNYDEISSSSSSSSNSRPTDKVKDFQNEMKQDHQIQQHELTLFDF
jgi:hypothetical protein